MSAICLGTITIPATAGGYGLSGWTLFTAGGPPGVPDGGTTAMLLGTSLGALGMARRFEAVTNPRSFPAHTDWPSLGGRPLFVCPTPPQPRPSTRARGRTAFIIHGRFLPPDDFWLQSVAILYNATRIRSA